MASDVGMSNTETLSVSVVSAEDARERGELQRAYYSLLHATTSNELTGVLLATPATTRNAALEGLVRGAASHVDAVVRKTCMQARPSSSWKPTASPAW